MGEDTSQIMHNNEEVETVLDEKEVNLMREVNERVVIESAKKMVFNIKNLRAHLHEDNLTKLRKIGFLLT